MGKKSTYYYFDQETGKSLVVIWDKGRRYVGKASVNEEDLDVKSEKTGLTIAEFKANIKRYDSKAAECAKEIKKLENMLEYTRLRKFELEARASNERDTLDTYLKDKQSFATKLRTVRAKNAAKEEAK